jgi:hypothetical protein
VWVVGRVHGDFNSVRIYDSDIVVEVKRVPTKLHYAFYLKFHFADGVLSSLPPQQYAYHGVGSGRKRKQSFVLLYLWWWLNAVMSALKLHVDSP